MDYDLEYGKKVGTEARRSFEYYAHTGFFDKYMQGVGLDIGFAGYEANIIPILPTAIGIDVNYPGYDGRTLPFSSESQNYIFSSHCLEHISDYKQAIREWYRVLKIGGFMIVTVPHQFLYEKKKDLPSKWNGDHRRFYSPASLLKEIEESLTPNTYRVRMLEDVDRGFNYDIPPDKHSDGCYEILVVLEKIKEPQWTIK